MKIQSLDGNLELALFPAAVELRLSPKAAKEFDAACEAEKSASWLPVWRQIKGALVSASQLMAQKVADGLCSIPLEAITDVNYVEGRLEIWTSAGNQLGGSYRLSMGSLNIEYQMDTPGIFPEAEVRALMKRITEIKPMYAEYLARLQGDAL